MSRTLPSASFSFSAISVEGNLLAPAILKEIANSAGPNQTESDYHVPRGVALRDELARYFRIGQATFRHLHASSAPSFDATTRFASDLLVNVLGFSTVLSAGVLTHDGHQFPVALQALGGRVPVVVVPPVEGLEVPSAYLRPDGRRRSAAIALQDWLNVNDGVLWGLCTNGNAIRLLRDNRSLTRPAFIEFDLQQIFENEDFASFTMLWLLLHSTRFGQTETPLSDCPLERWREAGVKTGEVALRHLAANVHEALLALGNGFLEHPANNDLRQRLASGALALSSATGEGHSFFSQLLRLVYRLIFLLAAEDRDLLHPPDAGVQLRDLYALGYSAGSLRDRAVRRAAWDNFDDRWQGLRLTFKALAHGEPWLGLPALGGLFSADQTPDLDTLALSNHSLFRAMYSLAWLRTAAGPVPVNWRDMQTEELGSVYEGLLELTPRLADTGRAMTFAEGIETKGNERKTSGSYYTPDALVQTLLDSALDPVLDRIEAESRGTSDDAAAGLLTVTVIDPACGSGHFLLAAARRIATRVARLRANGVPSQGDYRRGLRDAVRLCIYGVDRNPMAVELSRVALWIETVEPGKPLGFLDANLRCGDALLGIFSLQALNTGIPEEAYKPLADDDKLIAKVFSARNKEDLKGQGRLGLFGQTASFPIPPSLARAASALRTLPEESEQDIEQRAQSFYQLRHSPELARLTDAADLYIAAFLAPKKKPVSGTDPNPEFPGMPLVPVSSHVWKRLEGGQVQGDLLRATRDFARKVRAFHWPLEFPHILLSTDPKRNGFDVVLGNPPWEVKQLNETEFFAVHDPELASLRSAKRKEKIRNLKIDNPTVYGLFETEKELLARSSQFLREATRFALTAIGKLNTYSLFSDLALQLNNSLGRTGLLIPTGIAFDESTQYFFQSLIKEHRLVSLFSFYEVRRWFPGTDDRKSFCLIVLGTTEGTATFAFDLRSVAELSLFERVFELSEAEIACLNPNTKNSPVFRSRHDAELTKAIYKRLPTLSSAEQPDSPDSWRCDFRQGLFNMSSESSLFVEATSLCAREDDAKKLEYAPLIEAKMVHIYDHRRNTYDKGVLRGVSQNEKYDSHYETTPYYFAPKSEIELRLASKDWEHGWLLGWRDIVGSEGRTLIPSIIPRYGVNDKFLLIFPRCSCRLAAAFYACIASLACDYVAKQKVGGSSLKYFVFEQLAILPPSAYTAVDLDFIVPRVLELTYTSNALAPFALDLRYEGEPFLWDEDRRALLRAELDAWYARAYRLTRDDLRYILDPTDLLGDDYPSETFRVLKKNEISAYGYYRTQRLVLEAWDRQAAGDIPASELHKIPQAITALPSLQSVDCANLDNGAWMNRALFPDRDADAYGALAAIVHALQGPTPPDIVRLAYRFALVPKKLTPFLDDTNRALWLRLVGHEAQPNSDNIAEMAAAVDAPFGQALRTLRSQGAVVENRAAGTWELGNAISGLDFNAPLESRARFALDAVRSIGINQLRGSMQPEEVAWLERRLA